MYTVKDLFMCFSAAAWDSPTLEHDSLKHIVDRVVAGVQSIINTTTARLPADITRDLLAFRDAASPRFHVRLGVDNTHLDQGGLGIHINITSKDKINNSTEEVNPVGGGRVREDDGTLFETRLIFSEDKRVNRTDNEDDEDMAGDDISSSSRVVPRNFRPDARGRRRLDEELLVTTPAGTVRGAAFVSPSGVEYYRFDGVPYAEPPVGELRFRPPVKKRPARGVLNGNRTAPVQCLQETIYVCIYWVHFVR
jgi:hypothetical protein